MVDDFIYPSKPVKDCFKAFLTEGATFTKIEEYPIINKWMISNEIPDKIIPFDKIKYVKNIKDYWICFYCADQSFEKIYNNPKKYIDLFKKAKGIIGFDFSIHTDLPLIKQKEQINKNLSLSFFYALRNIPFYPNVRYGDSRTTKEFYKAIPKKCPVCIGTYGFIKTKIEKENYKEFIHELITIHNPAYILVYGSIPKEVFEECYNNNIPIYAYESWKSHRFKEIKNGRDKRA